MVSCEENDYSGTVLNDEDEPAMGEGWIYLVRGVGTPCGLGTYDSTSAHQVAGRDTGIQSAAAACP